MLEDYFFKKPTKWILIALVGVVVALLLVDVGIQLGEHSDEPPFNAYGLPLPHVYVAAEHGAAGVIQTVSLPASFVILSHDGDNDTIFISSSTELEPQAATSTVLVPGARVIIIGEPESNEGIRATLIRVLQ